MAPKQVIVMRTDLGMRRGKQIAQGAHASLKVLLDNGQMRAFNGNLTYSINLWEALTKWLDGSFTKVCVRVDSEEELLAVVEGAKEAGLPVAMVTDSGKTEFHGEPTNTCCAIGPADEEKLNKITGHLTLL